MQSSCWLEFEWSVLRGEEGGNKSDPIDMSDQNPAVRSVKVKKECEENQFWKQPPIL
jgi:hypothetical protein